MSLDQDYFYEQAELSKFHVRSQRQASIQIESTLRVADQRIDNERQLIITEMVSYVWAEKRKEEHTTCFSQPATWWDAFKLEHFPVWLRKKYPAKLKYEYRTIKFERSFVYPNYHKISNEPYVIHDSIKEIKYPNNQHENI